MPLNPVLSKTVLDLFTEVAIVEHLLRTRMERRIDGELNAGQFGILNHLLRTGITSTTGSALAWAFQDADDHMAVKIDSLEAIGLIACTPVAGTNDDRLVTVTDEGRLAHARAIEAMSPEVEPLFEGLPLEDVQTSVAVLQEVRRTLDNLPDR